MTALLAHHTAARAAIHAYIEHEGFEDVGEHDVFRELLCDLMHLADVYHLAFWPVARFAHRDYLNDVSIARSRDNGASDHENAIENCLDDRWRE